MDIIQKGKKIEDCLSEELYKVCTRISPNALFTHYISSGGTDNSDMYFWYDGPQMWRTRDKETDYFVELLDDDSFGNEYTALVMISPNSSQTMDKAERDEISVRELVKGETGKVYLLAYRQELNDRNAPYNERFCVRLECCAWELKSDDIPNNFLQDPDVFLHLN